MLIIGLDTTSRSGSVSILRENIILGECLFNTGPRHSENVVSSLEWILNTLDIEKSEIEAVAVSVGPGSFTSLRVGLTIAKSLAYTMKIKLVSVSSLEVLAMNIANTEKDICALLDAKRGEVYSGIFRYTNGVLGEVRSEQLLHVDDLKNGIKVPTLFLGEGAEIHRERLSGIPGTEFAAGNFNITRSSNSAVIGMKKLMNGISDDVMSLVPNYLRKTDIETSVKT